MGIHRGILHHDIFRHTDTERGKVPQSLDSSRDNQFGHFLRLVDRDGNHSDRRSVFLLLGRKIIHVVDRYPVNLGSGQFPTDIEASNNLQSVLFQTGILQQGGSQATDTEQECCAVKPKKSSNTSTSVLIS